MQQSMDSPQARWILARGAVVVVLLGSLAGLIVTSHLVSQASDGRIRCLDNQAATEQALVLYQADHDGRNPRILEALRMNSRDRFAIPGRCPADDNALYILDPVSGHVLCPNAAHRHRSELRPATAR